MSPYIGDQRTFLLIGKMRKQRIAFFERRNYHGMKTEDLNELGGYNHGLMRFWKERAIRENELLSWKLP